MRGLGRGYLGRERIAGVSDGRVGWGLLMLGFVFSRVSLLELGGRDRGNGGGEGSYYRKREEERRRMKDKGFKIIFSAVASSSS